MAKKGTPQYEEWLKKYQAARVNVIRKESDGQLRSDMGVVAKPEKSRKYLKANPPLHIKIAEIPIWNKAVLSATTDKKSGEEMQSDYGRVLAIFRAKMKHFIELSNA